MHVKLESNTKCSRLEMWGVVYYQCEEYSCMLKFHFVCISYSLQDVGMKYVMYLVQIFTSAVRIGTIPHGVKSEVQHH